MGKQLPLIAGNQKLPPHYEERLPYRRWVTPQSLATAPIHRWFVFPHSFGRELVWRLLEEWDLGPEDHILDPFVGAGTTLLAAKEKGIPATGVDLTPLAVFVSCTKLADFTVNEIQKANERIIARFLKNVSPVVQSGDPVLLKWFTPEVLHRLLTLKIAILTEGNERLKDFFFLGLLAILSEFSLAVRDGGWLRWRQRAIDPEAILPRFQTQIAHMVSDLLLVNIPDREADYQIFLGDARTLEINGEYSAVITSPPYPNRHDYSRIFNVELCFAFLNQGEVKDLRHRSFRSHVEARPFIGKHNFEPPQRLLEILEALKAKHVDRRVPIMLSGYFEDLYHTLCSLKRVITKGGKLAFVVGNVRYKGEMIQVDELLAELAQRAGYQWIKTWIVRYRGNSAQQMGTYGREAARESVVIIENVAE